jgi:hypothetical protein
VLVVVFVTDGLPVLSLRGREAGVGRALDDTDPTDLSGIREIDVEPAGASLRPAPLVTGGVVLGVFAAEPGSRVSALRFDAATGLAGVDEADGGFSPVIEARRSVICIRHILAKAVKTSLHVIAMT